MTHSWRLASAFKLALGLLLIGHGAPAAQAEPAQGTIQLAQAVKADDDKDQKGKKKPKKRPPGQGGGNANAGGGGGNANPNAARKKGPPSAKTAAPNAVGQGTTFGPGNPKPAGEPKVKKAVKKVPPAGGNQQIKKGQPPATRQTVAPRSVSPGTAGAGTTFAPANAVRKPPVKRPDKAVVKRTYVVPPKSARRIDDMKKGRQVQVVGGGKYRVIKEPDRRVIIKQDNRVYIRHDESERFRRISRGARTARRGDGSTETIIVRDGGVQIINVTNDDGDLLYRSRRDRYGRETIIIDNRRYYERERGISGRDLAIGLGVGVAVGAAIVALAPPVHAVPREKYIVDYGRASDDDIYEALTAPPVERLERTYSLDEVRYSEPLRERMRRVDLDSVTFDFGSWEVGPDQYGALERIADGIMRALEKNGDEVFLIEGHTDAVGDEDDNLSLSDRRAQSVAEILTSNFGVPPENLVTQGYGEQYLKIPTQNAERVNRRIAVRRITPLMSENFRDVE